MLETKIKKEYKISFSEFKLFTECEHKHFLSYILGVKDDPNEILAFGSSIHKIIEDIFSRKKLEINAVKDFRKEFLSQIEKIPKSSREKIDVDENVKFAKAIINEANLSNRYLIEYNVFKAEQEIYEPIIETEDFIVYYKGFMDLVLKKKKGERYLITDWKSAMKPWSIDKKMEDKIFWGQLVLYRYFFAQKFNVPKTLIDTAFVTLIKWGEKKYERFDFEISEEFEEYIFEYIRAVAMHIIKTREKDKVREKAWIEGGLNQVPCQYCGFKNTNLCNSDPKQIIKRGEFEKHKEEFKKYKENNE